MHPQIEQIIATIEVLIEEPFYFNLAGYENKQKEAFGWDTSIYSFFSILNLIISEKWLVPTDPEAALADWKQPEETGVASDKIELDEDEVEEAGIPLDDATKAARLEQYQSLLDCLTANLHSIKAYTLRCDYDYSLSAIAGILPDNRWICLSPTVPQETGKDPVEEMRCILLENNEAISPASELEIQIEQILDNLKPIKIAGWYGGGYEHVHDYQLIYATGDNLESALENCLIKAGLVEVYKFDRFFPTDHSCGYDLHSHPEMGDRFERLNRFLKATFANLRMYRFCFWDYEHLYFLDANQTNDKAGIVMRSQFNYNP
jgi:hypothetical protein